jgi:DNA-binding beta-propeller fold protein YncE
MMKPGKAFLLILLFASFAQLQAQMLSWKSESPSAAEEFRIGVQSFQRGYFNESILSFEKCLSIIPDDPLVISWMARAYYRSGLDSTAADQWRRIAELGSQNPFASNRMEFLRTSEGSQAFPPWSEKLIETVSLSNKIGKDSSYKRPSWISPNPDGSFWLSAFGSDELVRYDVNGLIVERIKGPVGGFDRPFGIVRKADGGFFVTEYGLDCVSELNPKGGFMKRFGAKGRGDGQLLGPQYLCMDEDGYLYVSDYGNRRICKFDSNGQYILSFGSAQSGFPGLSSPTGVACFQNRIFVADSYRKAIYVFDRDGNFDRTLLSDKLSGPEGLTVYKGKALLVADTSRIVSVDLETEEVSLLYTGQEKKNKILCAVPDANGEVLSSDFDLSRISILSPESSVYSGFFVNVLRVNSERFPLVDVEVMVQDKWRRAINGLSAHNFYLTEQLSSIEQRKEGTRIVPYEVYQARAVPSFEVIEDVSKNPGLDSVFIMDSSAEARIDALKSSQGLTDLVDSTASFGHVGVVVSGKLPSYEGGIKSQQAVARMTANRASAENRLDLGIRLAASKLATSDSRRALFYVTRGEVGDTAFKGYSLSESAAYMENNNVRFYVIMLGPGSPDKTLTYLAESSGGQVLSLFRPQGLSGVISQIAAMPTGRYTLRFRSQANSDFGRSYVPFAVEAYLMKKSGRDEFGFFAPLK